MGLYLLKYPGFSLRSNPGLKLANAFGVYSDANPHQSIASENQLHRELDIPWSAAAEEWVSDADVGSHRDWQKACAASSRRID